MNYGTMTWFVEPLTWHAIRQCRQWYWKAGRSWWRQRRFHPGLQPTDTMRTSTYTMKTVGSGLLIVYMFSRCPVTACTWVVSHCCTP